MAFLNSIGDYLHKAFPSFFSILSLASGSRSAHDFEGFAIQGTLTEGRSRRPLQAEEFWCENVPDDATPYKVKIVDCEKGAYGFMEVFIPEPGIENDQLPKCYIAIYSTCKDALKDYLLKKPEDRAFSDEEVDGKIMVIAGRMVADTAEINPLNGHFYSQMQWLEQDVTKHYLSRDKAIQVHGTYHKDGDFVYRSGSNVFVIVPKGGDENQCEIFNYPNAYHGKTLLYVTKEIVKRKAVNLFLRKVGSKLDYAPMPLENATETLRYEAARRGGAIAEHVDPSYLDVAASSIAKFGKTTKSILRGFFQNVAEVIRTNKWSAAALTLLAGFGVTFLTAMASATAKVGFAKSVGSTVNKLIHRFIMPRTKSRDPTSNEAAHKTYHHKVKNNVYDHDHSGVPINLEVVKHGRPLSCQEMKNVFAIDVIKMEEPAPIINQNKPISEKEILRNKTDLLNAARIRLENTPLSGREILLVETDLIDSVGADAGVMQWRENGYHVGLYPNGLKKIHFPTEKTTIIIRGAPLEGHNLNPSYKRYFNQVANEGSLLALRYEDGHIQRASFNCLSELPEVYNLPSLPSQKDVGEKLSYKKFPDERAKARYNKVTLRPADAKRRESKLRLQLTRALADEPVNMGHLICGGSFMPNRKPSSVLSALINQHFGDEKINGAPIVNQNAQSLFIPDIVLE